MKANKTIKTLGLAFAGGAIALGGSSFFQKEKVIETRIIEKPSARLVNFEGNGVSSSTDFTLAADASLNSVVHITTETTQKYSSQEEAFYEQFFGAKTRPRTQRGSGSGVILSKDGYIVTNNHVIQGADKVNIILNDNREYVAKVIGTDPATDIAVVKVEADDLEGIGLGNSDDVKVGEWVLAVGNPFNLTSTVTAGIVSAKARSINIMDRNRSKNVFPIESFIQTDAAVNPGNSGGALVNDKGELIGINTAIASQTGSYAGYSFAVPVNLMKKVTSDLIRHGVVQRAFIGVSIQEVNQNMANELGIKQTEGIYVNGLAKEGAAKDAGIKEGDVIVNINNNEVKSVPALQEQVGKHQPGDKISVGLYRDNSFKTIDVQLKNIKGTTAVIKKVKSDFNNELAARLTVPSSKEMKYLSIENGIKVQKLGDGTLSDLGIDEGFIITKIGKKKIKTAKDLENELASNQGKKYTIEGIYPNGVRAMYENWYVIRLVFRLYNFTY